MDMLPKSTLSEEQRQNPYLADVTRGNADRQTRSVDSRQMVRYTGDQP